MIFFNFYYQKKHMTTNFFFNLWNFAHIVTRILTLKASDFNCHLLLNTNSVNTLKFLSWNMILYFDDSFGKYTVLLHFFMNKIDTLLKKISTTNSEFWKQPIFFTKLVVCYDSVLKVFDWELKCRTSAIITRGLYIPNTFI